MNQRGGDEMLRWFEYEHLPKELQLTSGCFNYVATHVVERIDPGPQRAIALQRLLEAKDAAVRAKLHPGG
jgi:hypothetical protein